MEDKKGLDPASLYYAVTSRASAMCGSAVNPWGQNTFGVFAVLSKYSKPQVHLGVT